jgi:hypothetical protein
MKPVRLIMTIGVSEYLEENLSFHRDLEIIVNEGMRFFSKSYFLSIDSEKGKVVIGDGDYNVLLEFESRHSKDYKLYFIRDDYGDHYVATLLFPEEY